MSGHVLFARDGSDAESAVPVAGHVGQGPCLELRKSATLVILSRFWFPSRCFWDCLGFVRGFGFVLQARLIVGLAGCGSRVQLFGC